MSRTSLALVVLVVVSLSLSYQFRTPERPALRSAARETHPLVDWSAYLAGRLKLGATRPQHQPVQLESAPTLAPENPKKETVKAKPISPPPNRLGTSKDEPDLKGDDEEDEGDLEAHKVAEDDEARLELTEEDVVVLDKGVRPGVLPPCKRTLQFKLADLHGLTSEFWLFLRVAVLALHHNYTLILDSSAWNYGPMSTYFLPPPPLDCTPPPDSYTRTRFPSDDYHLHDHLEWRRDVNRLDQALLALFPETPDEEEKALFPLAYEPVFTALEKEVAKWWTLTPELDDLAATLDDPASDTIGLHVRLGDKFLEIASAPGLHPTLLNKYIQAVQSFRPRKGKKTRLLVMSDDPNAWRSFARDPRVVKAGWRVVPALNEEHALLPTGFNETAFNALPLSMRMELTKPFVASLTALSRAPKLVMSASSNVGRFLALLAGVEAMAQDEVVSVDSQWYPTARAINP